MDPVLTEAQLGLKVKDTLDTMCRDLWNNLGGVVWIVLAMAISSLLND